jgi:hypothetical protein
VEFGKVQCCNSVWTIRCFQYAQFSNPAVANPISGTFGKFTSMAASPQIIHWAEVHAFCVAEEDRSAAPSVRAEERSGR